VLVNNHCSSAGASACLGFSSMPGMYPRGLGYRKKRLIIG